MTIPFTPSHSLTDRLELLGNAWRDIWRSMPWPQRLRADFTIIVHCDGHDLLWDGDNTPDLAEATSATISAD